MWQGEGHVITSGERRGGVRGTQSWPFYLCFQNTTLCMYSLHILFMTKSQKLRFTMSKMYLSVCEIYVCFSADGARFYVIMSGVRRGWGGIIVILPA